MGKLDIFLDAVLGANSTPEERARVVRIGFRVVVAGSLLWAFGLLSPFGLVGFARANDVDDKIQAAVEPVRAQLGAITTQLAAQDEVLRNIRIDQLATKLRELKRACCLSGGDPEVRHRMEEEIERAQRNYRELTGERYPLPECRELRP